jgi:hypothetical protein
MTNHPPTTEAEGLRQQLRAAHNRFHGLYDTHAEVAKHARWTAQELENVQIEDEEIYYDKLMQLHQLETAKAVQQAIIEAMVATQCMQEYCRATGKAMIRPGFTLASRIQ